MARGVPKSFPKSPRLIFDFWIAFAALAVLSGSYFAAELGGLLILRPQMFWPVWPGNAFLVAILLLAPKRRWPIFLAAGLSGFIISDLQTGLGIRFIALLNLADVAEILTVAFGVRYALGSSPRMNSLASLAKYSFFAVILAPIFAACISAFTYGGGYEMWWKICILTEALALLTLTPAILSWVDMIRTWANHSPTYYLELLALLVAIIGVGYSLFLSPCYSNRPTLLYSLVPFLLWSSLRFGIMGVSTSLSIVAFLSVWGAIHGRGPFAGAAPLENVLNLQLFILIASSSFMVLAALVEEHRQSLRESQESESRFRLVANTAPVMIWMSGPDKLCTYFNQPWLEFTGRPVEAELGNGWVEGVHAQDVEGSLHAYTRAFDRRESYNVEYRLRRYDGQYRWVLGLGVPRFNADGTFAGYIGTGLDVTEQKLAQEALSNMSRRLIEAHEQERTWIARELHDDINQRLALLAVSIDRVNGKLPASAGDAKLSIREAKQQIRDLCVDIQALSHRLHSSKLEYLGLASAAAGFCRELAERQGVEIDFQCDDIPKNLGQEISLCLFRVLQEALQNATKHSSSRHFEVFLKCSSDEIALTVSDSGIGFDANEVTKGHGLGIISMRERLKLVGGELSIDSRQHLGTTVRARVPLTPTLKLGSAAVA
jgi:PAS domain S-box-containing protein